MSQNVYQFIDLQRVDPPKKPLKIRKIEFVEIYEPFSEGQASPLKVLYNPKAFFIHAAWLHQACAHCAIFPTAASRRSLDRVSVPVWLVILSDQLGIVA